MERAIFRNADVIIANTEPAAEIWRARYPEFRGKVHVIWNAFDPEEQLGPAALPERPYKVIAHVGSVYPTRYPTAVLDAVERLSTRGLIHPDNLRIHFVGTVQRESMPYTDVLNRLVDAGLVTCTDAMPRAEAQQIMSSSDYLLLLDLVEDRPSIQVPAKIFEYLRIGRPILALTKHGSAIEQVLAWSGIPHCIVPPDGPASEIDQKILDFLSWPSSPAQIDPKFEEIFSPEHQARYLASLISPSRP